MHRQRLRFDRFVYEMRLLYGGTRVRVETFVRSKLVNRMRYALYRMPYAICGNVMFRANYVRLIERSEGNRSDNNVTVFDGKLFSSEIY